jgi:hypothetical protein
MGLPVVAVGLALAAARLAGASVAGHLVPGHRAALATAPPLLVAGIGSGFVILSNQALTLAEYRRSRPVAPLACRRPGSESAPR